MPAGMTENGSHARRPVSGIPPPTPSCPTCCLWHPAELNPRHVYATRNPMRSRCHCRRHFLRWRFGLALGFRWPCWSSHERCSLRDEGGQAPFRNQIIFIFHRKVQQVVISRSFAHSALCDSPGNGIDLTTILAIPNRESILCVGPVGPHNSR
jgi:hypothetical protein